VAPGDQRVDVVACLCAVASSTAPPCTQYGTLYDMAKVVPVREFRTKLSELLSDVADRRDHILVTRNGKPAAALVPIDEYEALEETAEILSDSATLSAIEAGLADLARGDTVTLDDLRRELAERRAAR
jgi:antitoxin YefM